MRVLYSVDVPKSFQSSLPHERLQLFIIESLVTSLCPQTLFLMSLLLMWFVLDMPPIHLRQSPSNTLNFLSILVARDLVSELYGRLVRTIELYIHTQLHIVYTHPILIALLFLTAYILFNLANIWLCVRVKWHGWVLLHMLNFIEAVNWVILICLVIDKLEFGQIEVWIWIHI